MQTESPLELSSSLFVCRTWHAIIVNDATLWATITLNSRICDHLGSYPPRDGAQNEEFAPILAFYETCLLRSKSALLKITIDLKSFCKPQGDSFLAINRRLLTLFLERTREHASRWKAFVWNDDITRATQDILMCLPPELPILQQLTISGHVCFKPTKPNERQFPICPNLQRIKLIDFWDHNYGKDTAVFQQGENLSVQDLTLGNNIGWAWGTAVLRHVAIFQNIHTLTLFCFSEGIRGKCKINSSVRVTLSHLRLLRLLGWVPNELLSLINSPDKLTVYVGNFVWSRWSVDSVCPLSGTEIATKMTTLHLEWSVLPMKQALLDIVFELLKGARCLEAVYLSPQAEKRLGHELEEFIATHSRSFSICIDWARVSQ